MIFLNSASSAAALLFYLPGVCTHTDTKRKQSPEYLKSSTKAQYLMNTLYNNCAKYSEMNVIYLDEKTKLKLEALKQFSDRLVSF